MSSYMGRSESAEAIAQALEVIRKYPHQWISYNPNDPLANSVVTYLKKEGKIVVNRFNSFKAAPKYKVNPSKRRKERAKALLLGREKKAPAFDSPEIKNFRKKYARALEYFQRTLPKSLRPKKIRAKYKKNPGGIKPLPRNPTHPDYTKRVKLSGYNGPITVLSAHGSDAGKVLRKLHPQATREEHLSLAKKYKKRADTLYRAYASLLDRAAKETFGRKWQTTDYRVSGIGSDAFSSKMKTKLRRANQELNMYASASQAHEYAAGKRRNVGRK